MILLLVLILLLICSVAFYIYIEKIFNKNRKIKLKNNKSGFEVARNVLDTFDLNNIYITESRNELSSRYDPNRKVIRLTDNVFNEEDIVSCSIASMEASHAVLDKNKDKFYNVKKNIMPSANILLILGYIITVFGCIFGHVNTITIGLCIIDLIFVLHVLTYKIEKNAMNIALITLFGNKVISKSEYKRIEELLKVASYRSFASIVFPVIELFKKLFEYGK